MSSSPLPGDVGSTVQSVLSEHMTEAELSERVKGLLNNGLSLEDAVNNLKTAGNEKFRTNDPNTALKLYNAAIKLKDDNPILYANRSAAHLRLENYGYALQDANRAIECDPTFVKAYYRRASAYMALGRYKDAVASYELVAKARPNDQSVSRKLEECRRQIHRIAFERAICLGDKANEEFQIDVDQIEVAESYAGPRLDDAGKITKEFVVELIDHFKNQRKLHRKFAYQILLQAREHFKSLPTLINLDIPEGGHFTICGDIHGQYFDLLNIFGVNGHPSDSNPYLFNGDFVDRGSFSTECIFLLLAYKLLYPQHFFLTRGNHEAVAMNEMYGFMGEVKAKYDDRMFKLFTEIFNYLPLCYVLNNSVAIMHGGLFTAEKVTLDSIKKIDRVRQPPESGLMCDILWSDPCEESGRHPSKRGVGLQFGPDITKEFCELNNLKYIIRSHEMQPEGISVTHDGKCITVFSAPNYCDSGNNKGAFLRIKHDMSYEAVKFEAVPHPDVKPMAYSNAFSLLNFM